MGSYASTLPESPGSSCFQGPAPQIEIESAISVTSVSPVAILKEILKRIKLDEDLKKENNDILHGFLQTFLDEMERRDALFESLYNGLHYTGSFYSDLRIAEPDEFDINIKLKLPFRLSEYEVIPQPQTPSFMKYRLINYQQYDYSSTLMKTFFQDEFLIPEKVRRWLQSVVDKALRYYTLPSSCNRIHVSQAGPARTIYLYKYNGQRIDIDLVPCISFVCDLNNLDGRVMRKVGSRLTAFLVPKPFSSSVGRQMPVNAAEIRRLWRIHFPEAEKDIIHDLGCVKPIIKLLKLMRDEEDWKILASYYLKTVVMWMIIENPSPGYWRENQIVDRFIEALEKLCEYVNNNRIPYLFNKKYNLIEKMNDAQAFNIKCRLRFWIRKIEADKNNLWYVLKQAPAFFIG